MRTQETALPDKRLRRLVGSREDVQTKSKPKMAQLDGAELLAVAAHHGVILIRITMSQP